MKTEKQKMMSEEPFKTGDAEKKLISKKISPDLPVQAYHYRKVSIAKILEWDDTNKKLNAQITDFLKQTDIPVLTCKSFKDYSFIFDYITSELQRGEK